MGNFEQTLSTCSTVLNYATGHDGILSPAELADLLGVQKEFTGMQDAGKAARENLAAQRKERLGKAVTLRTTLSAAKAHIQSLAAQGASAVPAGRLGTYAWRLNSILSVAASYRKALEAAGDDPYTTKLLARLNTDAGAFEKADAEVRGQWTALKTRSSENAAGLDELTNKVRALRHVVEYRVSSDERVKFRQMLRTGSRGYVRHGNAEQTGAPAQTATPAVSTTTQAAA